MCFDLYNYASEAPAKNVRKERIVTRVSGDIVGINAVWKLFGLGVTSIVLI